MKNSNIYVNIDKYHLQVINILWCRRISQHEMLFNPFFNNTSIGTYQGEILPQFMLPDGVYLVKFEKMPTFNVIFPKRK